MKPKPKQKKSSSSPRNKCVYTHSRKGKVFYVGMGSIHRASETSRRSSEWYKKCQDLQFKVRIIAKNLSTQQAKKLEKEVYQKRFKHLINKPILEPGVNALEQFNWQPEVTCSKISGRTIRVPWMMLDSYNLPGEPFRAQITINGRTKRFFAKNLEKLFHDFSGFALCEKIAIELFTATRKADMAEFICCYEHWVKNGSKRFLEQFADRTRYQETLKFYIENENRLVQGGSLYTGRKDRASGISKSESGRNYHLDCSTDDKAKQKHILNIAQFKERLAKVFGG